MGAGEMAGRVRTLAALAEDQAAPGTHRVGYNCLVILIPGDLTPLLALVGTRCACRQNAYIK